VHPLQPPLLGLGFLHQSSSQYQQFSTESNLVDTSYVVLEVTTADSPLLLPT
jgi:hypothetical protein